MGFGSRGIRGSGGVGEALCAWGAVGRLWGLEGFGSRGLGWEVWKGVWGLGVLEGLGGSSGDKRSCWCWGDCVRGPGGLRGVFWGLGFGVQSGCWGTVGVWGWGGCVVGGRGAVPHSDLLLLIPPTSQLLRAKFPS